MQRLNILLIFGGRSSEHDVSINSAKTIYDSLDPERYNVLLIKITSDGGWRFVHTVSSSDAGAEVILNISARRFELADGTLIDPDVVFPVLHGKYGEDGTIQGLLEMMNLPYVGCDVESSALCMDKARTKRLLEQAGIGVVPFICVSSCDDSYEGKNSLHDIDANRQFEDKVGSGPWFVKPSRAGSSVGVTKVRDRAQISSAIKTALEHDNDVLIEKAIDAHEVEVAVMGNSNDIVVSRPGVIIPGEEFYSYADKYAGDSKSRVSLELPSSIAHLEDAIVEVAQKSYTALGCRGLSRVDFFVTDKNKIFVNEINTMPGFTSISMYPKMMQKIGYELPQLVDKLVALALK